MPVIYLQKRQRPKVKKDFDRRRKSKIKRPFKEFKRFGRFLIKYRLKNQGNINYRPSKEKTKTEQKTPKGFGRKKQKKGGAMMKTYLTSKDIAEVLNISEQKAYALIRELNKELKAKGYLIIRGRTPRKYFEERLCIERGD